MENYRNPDYLGFVWEDEDGNVFDADGERFTDIEDSITGANFRACDEVWCINPKTCGTRAQREAARLIPEQFIGRDTIEETIQKDARKFSESKLDGILYSLDYAGSHPQKKAIMRDFISSILRKAQDGAESLIDSICDVGVAYAGELEKEVH